MAGKTKRRIMFGHIMRFNIEKSELVIEMGPLKREDMPEFIKYGGMQSYEVSKFLGRTSAPVLEDEYEWFDKARGLQNDVLWGIYVVEDESRTIIGTTGLHSVGVENRPFYSAVSGFMIFRPEYWGKGIAGACHRARTMYAFDVLGLVQIRSGVLCANEASRRAVESVGYVNEATGRMHGLYRGEPRYDYRLACINPEKYAWAYWWGKKRPGKKFQIARTKTIEALNWAREHVELP